ncbi:Uncharacterised protein [Metamycoplasma cloacale]|uniref:Uncharacterized protein n=1 Tax=Metamycoplasma cloacale TaxID=92401 RepID=A0A2Z4LLR2_9BACT|nr:hypothetical protein [Metamycoplasma cloacale]AWX42656.1 hypothetical protein DK849_00985 [Metamycoplasma cloacale]VEU79543.1 Uncharacterised protein [Metamycoplasma cloacale]
MSSSKSRKWAIVSLSLYLISFALVLGAVLWGLFLVLGMSADTSDPHLVISLFITSAGVLVLYCLSMILGILSIIFGIIAAVKAENQTAKILTIVGFFVFGLLAIIGLSMIISQNKDAN